MDDQGIAHSAAVGILLIPAKGGVPGLRPPPWDVRVRVRPADVVEPVRHDFVDVLGYEIEEAELIHDAVRAALLAGPVVRAEHDEGVFEQTLLFEEADQPADLRIRMVEEAGERLLQARGEYLLVLGQLRPRQHARVAGSEGRPTRDDPNFELPGEPLIADYVPTFEEASPVLLDVRLRRLVGGVHRAERQVEEEGPVGAHRPEIADPADRLIDEVLAQVVPVLRTAGRLDMVVVSRELRVKLVRLALKEAVEAVEALLQRPVRVRTSGRALVHRREVPLAGAIGGVAVFAQEFRKGRSTSWNRAAHMGETAVPVGHSAHAHRMVVASCQQASARGGAERCRVKVRIEEAICGQAVDVRRLDGRAVAAEVGEASVIEDDRDYVWGILRRRGWGRPPGLGVGERFADDPFEFGTWQHLAPSTTL